ncbi:MAG: aspartate ammonia-lyase [Desulfohalobiaceae bacterium]
MRFREEIDSLGKRQVPLEAYYGIQTVRAMENFQITGISIAHFARLIQALACVKKAAALTNMELGLLPEEIGQAIVQAAEEVREGRLNEYFTVDVIQGGAGTSVNMNANEVICNRALEILGHKKGEYQYCHPNNHVNLSQSTNDVYPTALRIAAVWTGFELNDELDRLQRAFLAKGKEFESVIKMGRTQLQDAVPMTMGQEFSAYGVNIGEDVQRLGEALKLLLEINMGATAIGTGINTVPEYAELVCQKLGDITGLDLRLAPNLIEATSDTGAYVQLSGILKRISVKLSKICSDIRLLSSGPYAGFREINLPAVQPGSSIMPGKVNPVIPEMLNQVCYQVLGNDLTVTFAAEAGQLQLNVFEPIIAFNLFQSMQILQNGCSIFNHKCLQGITANVQRCRQMVKDSMGLVTALVPCLGYDQAADLAKQACRENKSIYDLVLEKGLLSPQELEDLLDLQKMTCPRPGRFKD